MYKLDPINDGRLLKPEIPVPFCMYSMPPISQMFDPCVFNQRIRSEKSCGVEVNSPLDTKQPDELDDILTRQRLLLGNLRVLQKRLEDLTSPSPTSSGSVSRCVEQPMCAKPQQRRTTDERSVVIRCSPSRPAHAVFDVLKQLGQFFTIRFTSHMHSSVRADLENVEALTAKILNDLSSSGDKPILDLTLIWFDLGGDCDFLVKPLEQRRVAGEANVARYLHRLLPGNELTGDPGVASCVDQAIEELESKFLWNTGSPKDAVALAKRILSDRSANQLVSSLANSFLRNVNC